MYVYNSLRALQFIFMPAVRGLRDACAVSTFIWKLSVYTPCDKMPFIHNGNGVWAYVCTYETSTKEKTVYPLTQVKDMRMLQ